MRSITLSALLAVALVITTTPMPAMADEHSVTLEELKAAYPGLPLREVSMAEFNALRLDPMRTAQLIVEPDPDASQPAEEPSLTLPNFEGEVTGPGRRPYTPEYRGGPYNFNLSGLGNIDSKETAIVVFVVAGVVVVAAAILYSGALIYNLVANHEDAPPLWWEPHARFQYFSSGSQQGWMYGGGVTLGFESEDAEVGLVLEGGYLDADVDTIDDRRVSVASGYGMAGPVVRWYFGRGPHDYRLDMELLAGGASGYSLISRAGMSLTWAATESWRIGANFGALYLDVKESDGPVYEAGDDFNTFLGLQTGWAF